MAWRGLVKAPVPVTFCMVYAPRGELPLFPVLGVGLTRSR